MPCTVLNNMSKCRALMDKTKANRFLHISPCLCAAGTTLPRGRSQEGNQKLKTQLIHIWLVSLWRRDLSTPVLWNKNSTYYRYVHHIVYENKFGRNRYCCCFNKGTENSNPSYFLISNNLWFHVSRGKFSGSIRVLETICARHGQQDCGNIIYVWIFPAT